ncbi:MAG TPA: ABC transporter permease [Armatimonadota bacterium]|jgi:phospholipid/cholesterol/gamma-HCH transport system permease protein
MNPLFFISDIGRSIIAFLASLGSGAIVLKEAMQGVFITNARVRGRIIAQMALVGIESLPIVLITLLFGGMVLGLHTAKQMVSLGAGNWVGSVVALSMAREVAPTFTGIVVAARIGSAFAAELGSMKITNQVDALRALATNPIHYLVTPRLLAAAIMLPVLTMFANITGSLGGALVAISAGVSYQSFITSAQTYLEVYDIVGGLLKTVVFGIIIAITACYVGLNTEGGAAGVGRSTTSAVVWSIVLLYASNFVMSWILYAFRQ